MGITPIIAGVTGLLGLGGSAMQANAASTAGQDQVQAAQIAAQTQLQMYNQTRQDLMPWMNTGQSANSQLAYLYGLGPQPGTTGGTASGVPNYGAMTTALENTPGYQFTLDQGTQALDRSAASQGLLLSGGQQKAVTGYGQNLAVTNAWAPYIAQLNAMSTGGQNSAAKTGELGSAAAGNIGSAQLAAGTAAANSALGGATAWNAGLQGISGLLQSQYGSSYGSAYNGSSGVPFADDATDT